MPRQDPLRFALSFLIPPRCAGCGCEPPGARDVLCSKCSDQMPRLTGDLCPFCALPVPCVRCLGPAAPWESVGAACVHAGPAPGLVVALKGSGSKAIARVMALEMSRSDSLPAPSGLGVVSVPGHPARFRSTGVDHAQVLGSQLAEVLGRPFLSLLKRDGGRGSGWQAGASRTERMREGRIRVSCLQPAPPECLLVDDVHTTGASLAASAGALLDAGAQRVFCMTFARTLPPGVKGGPARSW